MTKPVGDFQTATRAMRTGLSSTITATERVVFHYVAEHPGATNGEVAEAMHLPPEQVSRALRKLLLKKWVIVREGLPDRRVKHYGITAEGLEDILSYMSAVSARLVTEIDTVVVWRPDG